MHLLFLSSSCAEKGRVFDFVIQVILTAWGKILFLKLTIRHLVKKFPSIPQTDNNLGYVHSSLQIYSTPDFTFTHCIFLTTL